MLRLALAIGLAASALALASPTFAETTQLMPGVTYDNGVQFTPHGPVAIRVVRGPRPVGLYRLRPVLSNEAVVGRETVSSMQRRLKSQATMVGVNGDFFASARGGPSGIVLRDGVLTRAPNRERSSAGIALDGTLDVRRIRLFGSWQGLGERRPLSVLNEPPGRNEIALFTSDWGSVTPRTPGALNVVLSPFPAATPNADLIATVAASVQSESVAISPGTAVLVARGTSAAKLSTEVPLGTTVTVRLNLRPDWATVGDAVGGGPVLVRDGAPVFRAHEGFTTAQLAPRHPRSAVGQLADGRVLLVAVDGRQSGYSVGMTNFELAQTMLRLGAVRAMALDGGGSTTLAFDGSVLNRPSDGRERPVSTALMLIYSGVYAPPPEASVFSPNGDGVGDEQALSYKLVRPSNVTVTLTAPDGTVAFQEAAPREAATYDAPFPPPPPPLAPPPGVPPATPTEPVPAAEGRWTLTIAATDDQGLSSSTTRRFWVNSTLGYLRVAPRTLRLPPRGSNVTIRWAQERAARVTVQVETWGGVLLKTVVRRAFEPGQVAVVWNGRRRDGRLAYGGRYRVRVLARNELGSVSLEQKLTVRRIAGAKKRRAHN